jgi:drug/metabolite transporter (DMT)-like permease
MPIFVMVALSTILGIAAQLTLKLGMTRAAASGGALLKAAFSPMVIGGLIVYGTGVLFWLMALSRLEVSYLYPFASLSYVGITFGSYVLFKERITRWRLVGIAIIIAGVILVGISK